MIIENWKKGVLKVIKIENYVKDQKVLEQAVKRCREMKIILPTFEQQRNPELVPAKLV